MSDVDLIISVHTTGVKDVANLSASVRNLALNLKGVTVPMRSLDAHAKAVNKALGITSKGVQQHANSLKQLKANQAALSEESKRLRSNIQNYNLAILKAGGPTTKLGKELTFTQNQLKAFSTTLRGLRIRSFGSDLSNISLRLQKMGKDAQFVGRSLMINLTAPLLLFARTGLQNLVKVDAALVRLTKVLEGVAMTAEQADAKLGKGLAGPERQAAIQKMVGSFKALDGALTSLSNKFGVSKDLVVGLATDFAELGISANENIAALTELTLVTEKLGNMDAAGAQDLSQALYFNSVRALEASGAFEKLTDARDREARAIASARTQLNMFNNIENVTALTLRDLADSLPEVGGMAVSFGLSMTEAAALLAPMKAAGLDVGASANSIKVSLQRAISPTKQNAELLASLAKQYGVASDTQNIFNQTTKTGLTGLQAIVDVFMKVESSSAGAEGALKLMSEIFEKRQGPRMYIAIQQMGQFNRELNKATRSASTSEGILASVAEGALGKFNQLNRTSLPATVNNFRDIGIIARIATAQAGQLVEGYGKVSAAEIKTAKEVRKAVADVVVQKKQNEGIDIIGTAKTESARAMLVELAGASNAQQVADMELEQSLGSLEVAVQKIKNAFKLFAADLMKTIGPALKSMADKIQAFYEKWQSLSEATRQNISKVILGFLAFLAILGPVVLGIGTIQASMGVLGRALTGLLPKLKNVDGGFDGLGISADFAKKKIQGLYGTIVKSSLTKKLSFSGDLAEAQATAQAAMGTFAGPKAAKTPVLSSLLSPVNKGKITQSEQLKEFLSRNVGATKSDFLKSRTISNKIAAGKALTPAQYTYQLTNAGKVASIPGAVAAGRATAAAKIAGINTNITAANTAKTARAARQNLVNARNPFYEAKGIATDRMGTRFFRAGEELVDDVGPTRPTRTRGALSRLTGGRISATRRLLGTAEDQANILAGGGLQGAKLQTQLRARKTVGSIKDFATTSKPANLGKGFVEALRPIKQYKAGVAGAQAAVTALQAKNATLGLSAPGTFTKMGTAIRGFVKNVKLADLAMKIFRMTMLATGIGAIILGIGVAVMLVVKNFGMFKEKAAGPLRGLAYAFGIIKKALLEITRPIQDMFAQFSNGESGVEGSVGGIVNIFKKLVGIVLVVAQGFRYLVNTIIKPYLYGVVNVVMAVVSIFKGNWGDALKFLTAAFARVAEVVVSIFVLLAKILIKIAAGIAKGIVKLIFEGVNGLIQLILLAIRGLVNLIGKIPIFKGAMDSANNAIKNFGSTVSGAMDSAAGGVNSVIDGIAGGIEGGYDAVGNLIKKGLKKGTDLGVKESKHSLQSGKKDIVGAGEEIGEETGEAIANATGDGFEENDPSGKIGEKLKDGIKSAVQELQDYIAGELKNAIGKYVDASTKALEKQRDAALKIYDTQIKTLSKLEKAEESLTKTKEYEANKRKLLDDKALNDEQFRRNYALAVYEGRTDDARMLQLEQVAQTKSFNDDLTSIESNRAKDLAKENLDALKDAINEAKDAAQKFFEEAIVKFQESVETITKFPPVTIQDYRDQIQELYNITNQTATDNGVAFEKMFTDFATTINTKMPNDVVGAFSTNLDELVLVAKEKYGLGSDTSENTVIGVTIGMLADIGGVFGDKKQAVIDSFGLVTTGLKDNFKESATAIVKAVNDDFLTPFAVATTKFKDDWEKVYKQAIIDGNKSITDSLRNNVEANKELYKELRASLDETTLKWLGLKAAAEAAGEAQEAAANAGGGGGGGGGTGSTTAGAGYNVGRADAFTNNNALRAARGLAPLTYQQFTQGTGLSTAAVIAKPAAPTFMPFVPTNTFIPPNRKKGGIIPTKSQTQNNGYPEGFIPAPTQEGVPALLHGGEYILNAKAVQRIGVGALNKMNNNLIPKFLKGGQVPKKNGGVTSQVRVVPDRIEGKTQLANKIAAETRLAATKAAGLPRNYIGPIVPAKEPKDWEQPGLSWLEKGIFYATAGENIKKAPGAILNALNDTAGSFYKFGNATANILKSVVEVALPGYSRNPLDNLARRTAYDTKNPINPLRGLGFSDKSGFGNLTDQNAVFGFGDAFNVITTVLPMKIPGGAFRSAFANEMLLTKIGAQGTGLTAREVITPAVNNIFSKNLSRGLTGEVITDSLNRVAMPQFRTALSAPPRRLALGAGSPLDDSMLPVLEKINGAIPLGRVTTPMPSVSLRNYVMHGGPEDLLGGMINPEFIRGGNAYAALRGDYVPNQGYMSVLTGTEQLQSTALLRTYHQMLSVIKDVGLHGKSDMVASRVIPWDRAQTYEKMPWGKQVQIAKDWIAKWATVVEQTRSGVPHSTGVDIIQGMGANPYSHGGAAHLLKIPDELLMRDAGTAIGETGSVSFGEIPFWGSHKPIASIKGTAGGDDALYRDVLAAAIKDANESLSTMDLLAFQNSMKVYGNTITPGGRGAILDSMRLINSLIANPKAVESELLSAVNSEQMIKAVSGLKSSNPYYPQERLDASIKQIISTINQFADPSLAHELMSPASLNPHLDSMVMSGTDAMMLGVADKVGRITYRDALAISEVNDKLYRDTEYINGLKIDERLKAIIRAAMNGERVNADIMPTKVYAGMLPSPIDVLNMINEQGNIGGIKIPKFKSGGYVPGSPSMAIPALLHGGEYVINADAVRNMGVRTMQSINQSKFRAPSGAPSYSGGGGSTSVSTVNINVDTFIGEEEWFKSMMKDYNINVLPKQQKAAGLESRTFTSYNGINQGL